KDKLEGALGFFAELMKLLHPFMPFITEEVWQYIGQRSPQEALVITQWPTVSGNFINDQVENEFELSKQIVSAMRNIRAESNLSPVEPLNLIVRTKDDATAKALNSNIAILKKLQKLTDISISTDAEKTSLCA